jgi:hypothetical protein
MILHFSIVNLTFSILCPLSMASLSRRYGPVARKLAILTLGIHARRSDAILRRVSA